MSGAPLLAAFGASGGMPPATLESVRVLSDGRARAIVGCAWPHGEPLDEAGHYETVLGESELASLRALAADPALREGAAEHGPIRPGSGRSSLSLAGAGGDTVKIAWGAFAELPAAVTVAAATLRRVLTTVREHPTAVIKLELDVTGQPGPEGLAIVVTLANRGREPVAHSLFQAGRELPRVAAIAPEYAGSPLPLSTYDAATPIALSDPAPPDVLAPGAELRLRASAPLALAPGEHAIVGFARGTLEVEVDGSPVAIDLFLIARPVVVRVS